MDERERSAAERTKKLLADAERLTGAPCAACGGPLCGHEAVLAVLLGARTSPRCLRCAAAEQCEAPESLRDRALEHVLRQECFLRGWLAASEREGFAGAQRPPCLFARSPDGAPRAAGAAAPAAPSADPAARYDAGDLGCGDLVLELRTRLRALAPGAVLAVRATDPAAPVDIPAWCRLTGNTLLASDHPDYLIRRKEDSR